MVIPAVAYAMEFLWTSIMVTVEIPQLFPELFGFNTQQNGLQMIAVIVGTIIGEQVGGRMSDLWMSMRRRKLGGRAPEPEFRLWLSYFGFVLCVVGLVVFLVSCLLDCPWVVKPQRLEAQRALVSCASGTGTNRGNRYNCITLVQPGTSLHLLVLESALLASSTLKMSHRSHATLTIWGSTGNQIVTTVLVTYSVDCYRTDAASVGVFITFVSLKLAQPNSRFMNVSDKGIRIGATNMGVHRAILVRLIRNTH